MPTIPPPPVPQKLREMFKDYPELIQRLQGALDDYVDRPTSEPFDGAILALLDTLSALSSEVRAGLQVAEASGDAVAVEHQLRKKAVLFNAGHIVFEQVDMDDLWDYFEEDKGLSK
jgi:hypothetical protein